MASRAASASPAEMALQDHEMLALQAALVLSDCTQSVDQGEVTSQGMARRPSTSSIST